MDKIEWQVQNEYLLDKHNAKGGVQAHSFMVWKSMGRIVRKGEKQKAFTVTVCAGRTMDPITGEDMPRYVNKTAYGFTEEQTEKLPSAQYAKAKIAQVQGIAHQNEVNRLCNWYN